MSRFIPRCQPSWWAIPSKLKNSIPQNFVCGAIVLLMKRVQAKKGAPAMAH